MTYSNDEVLKVKMRKGKSAFFCIYFLPLQKRGITIGKADDQGHTASQHTQEYNLNTMSTLSSPRRLLRMTAACMLTSAALTSCTDNHTEQLEQTAIAFAEAYFNWHYEAAGKYCTPASQRWLVYMASQVNQQDVDSLHTMSEGAGIKLNEITYDDGDTTATADMALSHFRTADSIGRPSRMVEHARYLIRMSLHGNQWQVNLSAPLRPVPTR